MTLCYPIKKLKVTSWKGMSHVGSPLWWRWMRGCGRLFFVIIFKNQSSKTKAWKKNTMDPVLVDWEKKPEHLTSHFEARELCHRVVSILGKSPSIITFQLSAATRSPRTNHTRIGKAYVTARSSNEIVVFNKITGSVKQVPVLIIDVKDMEPV